MDKARGGGDDPSVPKVIRDARPVSDWTTTSIASRHLVALLDAAGQPADALLAGAGVRRADLEAPDAALPLSAFRALWERAAGQQPDIGVNLVDRFPAGQMHVLAHLAMRSATVQAALSDACRHAGVTSAADRLSLEVQGDQAWLCYATHPEAPDNPWMAEHYLAMVATFMARACGQPMPVSAVEFAGPRQAPEAAYLGRFGVLPRFDAGANRLAFAAHALASAPA